jgi:hypothetical protein
MVDSKRLLPKSVAEIKSLSIARNFELFGSVGTRCS